MDCLSVSISFSEMANRVDSFQENEEKFGLFARELNSVATAELFGAKKRKGDLSQKREAVQRIVEKVELAALSREWKERYIREVQKIFQSFLTRLFSKLQADASKVGVEDQMLECVYYTEVDRMIQLFKMCIEQDGWAREYCSFMRRFQSLIKAQKRLGYLEEETCKCLSKTEIWHLLDKVYAEPIDLELLRKSAPFL